MARRGIAERDRIPVLTNAYHIPERIREIDSGYFVMLNRVTGQFEVHHEDQIGNTLALILPYSELDCRAIQRVKETRIEYAAKIFREMDENNEKLEQYYENRWKDETDQKLREIHRYVAPKGTVETIPDDADIIREMKG